MVRYGDVAILSGKAVKHENLLNSMKFQTKSSLKMLLKMRKENFLSVAVKL